MLRTNAPSRK